MPLGKLDAVHASWCEPTGVWGAERKITLHPRRSIAAQAGDPSQMRAAAAHQRAALAAAAGAPVPSPRGLPAAGRPGRGCCTRAVSSTSIWPPWGCWSAGGAAASEGPAGSVTSCSVWLLLPERSGSVGWLLRPQGQHTSCRGGERAGELRDAGAARLLQPSCAARWQGGAHGGATLSQPAPMRCHSLGAGSRQAHTHDVPPPGRLHVGVDVPHLPMYDHAVVDDHGRGCLKKAKHVLGVAPGERGHLAAGAAAAPGTEDPLRPPPPPAQSPLACARQAHTSIAVAAGITMASRNRV
jgi:hypothetical protein